VADVSTRAGGIHPAHFIFSYASVS
jgi:hypothetical protein